MGNKHAHSKHKRLIRNTDIDASPTHKPKIVRCQSDKYRLEKLSNTQPRPYTAGNTIHLKPKQKHELIDSNNHIHRINAAQTIHSDISSVNIDYPSQTNKTFKRQINNKQQLLSTATRAATHTPIPSQIPSASWNESPIPGIDAKSFQQYMRVHHAILAYFKQIGYDIDIKNEPSQPPQQHMVENDDDASSSIGDEQDDGSHSPSHSGSTQSDLSSNTAESIANSPTAHGIHFVFPSNQINKRHQSSIATKKQRLPTLLRPRPFEADISFPDDLEYHTSDDDEDDPMYSRSPIIHGYSHLTTYRHISSPRPMTQSIYGDGDRFVSNILNKLDLERYIDAFREFNIDRKSLIFLDEAVVEFLIPDIKQQHNFMKWLKRYKRINSGNTIQFDLGELKLLEGNIKFAVFGFIRECEVMIPYYIPEIIRWLILYYYHFMGIHDLNEECLYWTDLKKKKERNSKLRFVFD